MKRLGILLAVACAVSALAAGPAAAADRNFALRFSTNVNGQITIAANTLMQCPIDTPDPLMNTGCQATRDGTGSRNNNSFDMRWLDADDDPATFTSSSATLAVPSGARVLFAGLYWTGIQKKGEVIKGANGFVGVPRDPPNAAAIGTVQLRVPGASGYATITGQFDTGPIAVNSGYTAFADVTAQVASAGPGTYAVADVQTGTGGNVSAGWSLVVAYSSQAEPLRNLSVFDGLKIVSGSNTVSIPLSGFKTPASGPVRTTIGVVAAEGDAGTSGDYLTLDDQRLTDAAHPPNNTENSSIAQYGQHVTTKSPDWRNQLGYDASLFAADGFLGNSATTAMFRAKTSGDTYAPQAITFATELFSPNVTLTKTVSPSGPVEPGDTLTYTITATNQGGANALDAQLSDPIPNGTTYVGGSATTSVGSVAYDASAGGAVVAQLGTLAPNATATVTFQATVAGDRPLGEVIGNEATLSFTSPDLGLPVSTVASAESTVAYPDPGIEKAFVSSSGNQYEFDLVVTNEGTLATDPAQAVEVEDTGINGVYTVDAATGTGWSCIVAGGDALCERSPSDALAPGASYPPIRISATYQPGADVENDATVAGGGQPTRPSPSDPPYPAELNDTAFIGVGTSPLSLLSIQKSALTGTVDVGSLAGFRIEVRNNGPSASPNTVVVDTLPAGLTYASATTTRGTCSAADANGQTTVSCALGDLAVGADARIVIRAVAGASLAGTQVTNTASVSSQVSGGSTSDTANLQVRPATDLAVTKTASAATIDQGDPITYTITATNQGPAAAVRMQIVDRLPAAIDTTGTITITPSDSGSCTRTDDVVQCLWAVDVAANATRTVTIAANAKATVPEDDRKALNRVNVFSRTTELEPADNYAEAVVRVIPSADLQVTASGPSTVPAGGEGVVSFAVANNGPSTAGGSRLIVEIPSDLTPVAAPAGCAISGQTVTCELGSIASGGTLERAVTVRSATGVTEATRAARATVSTTTPDPVLENDTDIAPFVAGPVADLSIAKAADVTEVAPGGVVSYTITVANAGGSSSTGAVVEDRVPIGMTVESATSSIPEGCAVDGRSVRCEAGEIVPNASFQVLVVARVAADRAGATLVNTAELTPGAETDPNRANNTASATVRVTIPSGARARLRIEVAAPARVVRGRLVRVQVRVSNVSKRTANDVRVCVTIPERLRYVRSSGTRSGSRVCWDRAVLRSGKEFSVGFVARARAVGWAQSTGTASAGNARAVRAFDRTRIVRPGGGGPVTG